MHRIPKIMQVKHSQISISLYNSILIQNFHKLTIPIIIVQCQINLSSLSDSNISMKKKNRDNLYSVNWIESKPIIKNF